MSNDTTQLGGPDWMSKGDDAHAVETVLALVIVWSIDEPHRVGEVAFFFADGRDVVLGRGQPQADETETRVTFFRQTQTSIKPTAYLTGNGISRRQLRVVSNGETLEIHNIGRSPMLVNGQQTQNAAVSVGDVVEITNHLVLLCVHRNIVRSSTSTPSYQSEDHPFGEADIHGIVGESPAIEGLRDQIAFAAKRVGHVLIFGETGTGKELVARAIHTSSARAGGPFVSRNAATLPPGLVDAELFGNAKNYPNPGLPERPGLIGAAHKGTLFLDEIGELSEELQTHLLRVLDADGEYQRLGETTVRHVALRLIGATNRSIDVLKADFGARFPLRIQLTPLNERREDIPLLIRHILRRIASADPEIGQRFFSKRGNQPDEPRISPKFITQLLRRTYRTHTRELQSLLWESMLQTDKPYLDALPETSSPKIQTETHSKEPAPEGPEITRELLIECLRKNNGNQSQVWRELGLSSRFALYRLLKKFGIDASVGESS